jgi:pyridoxamine 5'-phosphate oxidase
MNIYKEAIETFQKLYAEAQVCGLKEPTALTLATSSSKGHPCIRTVLLKSMDEKGFVFFTNQESRKGQQLKENPQAALCFYWPPLDRQVIVEGAIKNVSTEEADAYWATRPRESQIGAWTSQQSRPLANRSVLENKFEEIQKKYVGQKNSTPPLLDRVSFNTGTNRVLESRGAPPSRALGL